MSVAEQQSHVVYFGHDRTDSKLISRIEHLGKLGFHVFALTFHRVKFNRNHKPEWDNVDLGCTSDYAYLHRLISLIRGAFRLFFHRRRIAEADFMFARNIDMVLLALFARLITGSKAPIAYEVLDVHRLFLGQGKQHKALRALERWVLRRAAALIVSSEGYIRNYFEPVQNYRGPWFLLENKVPAGSVKPPAGPPEHRPQTLGRPWVIGWCGTMRCVKSLNLLTEIARRHRDTVQICMRGYPTETGLDAFKARIENEPNMIYGGGYKGPDDLAAVYSEVDLNWTIELWDQSFNSDNSLWLLPNRLYEGGCCNVPPIALAGTETARRIEALDIGWVVEEPLADAVSALLDRLTVDDYRARQDRLKALPMSTFWEIDDLQRICNQLLTLGATKNGAMVSA
jgi:succinoglycan biosynthesis protein ExoL